MAISSLRGFLNKIADDIGSEDLADLKFLCGDKLSKRKLENITSSRDLFVAIGENTKGEEEQLAFLIELFHNARRLDLEDKVKGFRDSRKGEFCCLKVQVRKGLSTWCLPIWCVVGFLCTLSLNNRYEKFKTGHNS